jgi:CysZ protein
LTTPIPALDYSKKFIDRKDLTACRQPFELHRNAATCLTPERGTEAIMNLLSGIVYNLRGLMLGLRTPRLLILGLVRLVAVAALTVAAASLVLVYHDEILSLLWSRPASPWIVWLWHLFSWLLGFLLMGVSAVLAYLFSQVLFSVVIMDAMSRLTEVKVRGLAHEPTHRPLLEHFFNLVRQEIPRSVFPVLLTLVLTVLAWLTPLGPVLTVAAPVVAGAFLAWDATDLVPARQLLPFRDRLRLFTRALPFHVGFGLLFLIPLLNILVLSFAPVGGTLYFLDRHDAD